jgi:hypothetical protein
MRSLVVAAALAAVLTVAAPAAAQSLPQAGCDPLDPAVCLQPWPNDFFTRPDASTPTGKRLDLQITAMPRNAAGVPIRPDEYNRNDGFSPGSPIHTYVPGLDNQAAFERTGLVPITDMARAFDADQPAVVIDADSGERQLIWAEMDANAKSDAERNLYIRPGRNWEEGHRYIVALRFLRDAQGRELEAQPAFRAYRDKDSSTRRPVDPRREHMDELFKTLNQAGIKRKDLYLAWDFTVGSEQRISERMLGIRDDAFSQLGDTDLADSQVSGSAPVFRVTQVQETPSDPQIIRTVRGTFTVPCYLDKPLCPPGSKFLYTDLDSNTPTRIPGNTAAPTFTCIVPRKAQDGPQRVSLYGHGLFGSQNEVTAGNVKTMAADRGFVFCATDWWGMAQQDVPTTLGILGDLSNFALLPDRVQQGMLNFLLLGRLAVHPQGLASDPAFQIGGHGVLDTRELFYDGNSQGGIIGGSLTAVAPDFRRAVLGVPGMNYSTLLQRSVDFDQFAAFLYPAYPREIERPMIFSLIQQLWDRGEADGYAHHMTSDPLANTPAHTVLLHPALGDHQVSTVTAEVEARTIGAAIRSNPLDPGRSFDVEPFYAIPRIASFPYDGSVIEIWDNQITPLAPTTNTPNRAGPDPHGSPRKTPAAQQQKSEHLRVGGTVIDTCAGGPCHSLP